MPTCFGHPQPSSVIKVHILIPSGPVQKVRNLKPKWFVQVHLGFKLCTLILEDSQG